MFGISPDTWSLWCARPDLNWYDVTHTPLKRARLPIPPRAPVTISYYSGFQPAFQWELLLFREKSSLH